MDSITIPEKTYFKIGEVAKLLNLEPYVLRYWETEFDQLKPEKTKTSQRAYQRRDLDLLIQIRRLLYEEMFTIAGARRQLSLHRQGELPLVEDVTSDEQLHAMSAELSELQRELEKAKDQMESLRTAHSSQKAELVASEHQNQELQTSLANLKQELTELRESSASNPVDASEMEMMDRHLEELTRERDELRAALIAREQRRQRAFRAVRAELQQLRTLAS